MSRLIKVMVIIFAGLLIIGCAPYEPEPSEEEIAREIRQKLDESEQEKTQQEDVGGKEKEQKEAKTREEIISEASNIDHVEAEEVGENVILTIRERILFDTLRAKIKESAMPVLDEIAKFLLAYPDRIVIVAGHTDKMPTSTERFPSNWDLSAKRAVNTVKYISYLDELDESRLVAAGFGEHHPVAPNDTPKNRQLNRRVEFILLPPGLEREEIEVPRKR